MKKSSTSRQVQIFDAVAAMVGRGVSRLFRIGRQGSDRENKGSEGITKGQLAAGWAEVDELMSLGGPARLKQAMIESDKLLERALLELGYPGSLGEKLKAAKERFSEPAYQAAWQAHKLRNRIVHDEQEVYDFEIRRAIGQLRRAMEELTRDDNG